MIYVKQIEMYISRTNSVNDRIVSPLQPYVQPIVRRMEQTNIEFGSKINASLVNRYSFINPLSWDAYNEGYYLMDSIEKY
jgi:hypothetical protein